MAVRIQIRRGTAAQWAAANTLLATGEAGYETDTGRLKVGNGTDVWAALDYYDEHVADVIMSDGTIIAAAEVAAETAVDAEIIGRDLLEGAAIVEPELAFAVVDEDGRRTWLEAGIDGGLTSHSVDKISEHISGAQAADMKVDGLSFAIVDEDDRRTWIEASSDGKPSSYALSLIADGLRVSGVSASAYTDSTGAPYPVSSGPDIVCWGDSMTNGTGGGGTTYPSVLATLSGHTVYNRGVGGETSVTIAVRTGATPLLVIPVGGTIPASGSVTLTFRPINGVTPAPLLQIGGGSIPYSTGTLAGVPGTISYDSGTTTYSFTRTTPGSAVTVNRPIPWLDSESPQRRGDIVLLWIGANGPSHERAMADVAAIVQHLSPLDKRFLVIARPNSNDAEDAAWHDRYGRRFVAIRKYMVEYGLADAGITPTAQDTTDMAAGVVPTSLRVDSIHWTAAGYTILAEQINARLREMGWI